jgi:hypothetical protein
MKSSPERRLHLPAAPPRPHLRRSAKDDAIEDLALVSTAMVARREEIQAGIIQIERDTELY